MKFLHVLPIFLVGGTLVACGGSRPAPAVESNVSKTSAAGDAYRDIVGRVCGEDIPFKELAPESFWQRLKHVFKR